MALSAAEFDDLARRIHAEVSEARGARRRNDAAAERVPLDHDDVRQLTLALISDSLRELAKERLSAGRAVLEVAEEQRLLQAVQAMGGLGWAIEELLADPTLENIDINGVQRVFTSHSDGAKRRLDRPIARSDEELERWVRNTAARAGLTERRFDEGRPWLILRLPGGPRLFALMSVTSSVCLSIRVHRLDKVTLADLVGEGMMSEDLGAFLAAAVRARLNLIFSGGTNAGKTTLCRAALNECPEEDRLVTVEDSYELGLDQMPERHPDVVPLEAREPNAEGKGEITMRQLVRLALRMNPTRVVVGEVRGDEVLPMLHAMTMGNDGSMCTIHADSAAGVFGRIALFAIESPEHLEPKDAAPLAAEALDLIVHIAYDLVDGPRGRGKARFIHTVLEVTGVGDDGAGLRTNAVFRPGADGRAAFCGPLSAPTLERLAEAGWRPRPRSVAARPSASPPRRGR